MHSSGKIAVAAAGVLFLSACQSTGGMARLADAGTVPSSQDSQIVEAQVRLGIGKQALADRNYAAAIVALRSAALEPSLAAEAHNALGVAYGGIGRHDLAGRYFQRASNEDPTVEKYRDNFVRALVADRRARLALLERPSLPAAPSAPALPPGASREVAVSVLRSGALRPASSSEAPQVRLVRRSSAGVNLTTATGQLRARAPSPAHPLPVIENRTVARAPSPAPESPAMPETIESKAVLPAGSTPGGARTIMVALSSGFAGDQPRPGITTSGRLTPNPAPLNVDRRKAASFAEVFAPMLRTEVHALGLRPSAPPVTPDLEGIQPADERLAAAFR